MTTDRAVPANPHAFGPCPKCESEAESCKYETACGENGIDGGHLVVRCSQCRFAWIERPSDV